LLRQTIWSSFIKIRSQCWPLECKQEFPKIWPGDLVFYPTWPIFKLGLDIGKTNILTKFHKNRITNVDLRVWTSNVDGRQTTDDDGRRTTTDHYSSPWAKNKKCWPYLVAPIIQHLSICNSSKYSITLKSWSQQHKWMYVMLCIGILALCKMFFKCHRNISDVSSLHLTRAKATQYSGNCIIEYNILNTCSMVMYFVSVYDITMAWCKNIATCYIK